jgi:sulfatase modifying factor 1
MKTRISKGCLVMGLFLIAMASRAGGMVLIAGGEFEMGDHFDVGDADEKPVHAVHVGTFYIGATEVTNQEYCDYLNSAHSENLIEVQSGAVSPVGGNCIYCKTTASPTHWSGFYSRISFNGSVFSPLSGKEGHPIQMVSWYGAAAYCNWLSVRHGYESCYDPSTWDCDFSKNGYRLPTEAEWEYAARGGLRYCNYAWGDVIDDSKANYNWNGGSPPGTYTVPIASYAANGYGLYDSMGNVWEFCQDWYSPSYYNVSPDHDPQGPSSGSDRVIRGGGYGSTEFSCRVANREWYNPNHPCPDTGFRIVRRSMQVDQAPAANAGSDQTIECSCRQGGTYATLGGSGSSDPDGDPLTYTWTGPFEGSPVSGPSPTVKLMPGCRGSYEIALVVNDGKQNSPPDTVQITVQDTTPPSLVCPEDITVVAQSPSGVAASVPAIVAFLNGATASDNCDPAPAISHDGPDQFPLGGTVVTFTATDASLNTSTGQAIVMVIVEDFYLHGAGSDLTLDNGAPTGATPKYKDSPSLRRTEFREIGTWTYAVPSGMLLHIGSVKDLHVWVGLKNSDDQGTYFDIRAELLKNDTAVASGEVTNIQGVTRNPDKAKEVVLDFGVIPTAEFNPGDVLSLRILTKVTDVGGHNSAVGLRLYYDSVSRSSRFRAGSSQ